ncbi:hypothetical protein D9619_008858 [Psilocybe cf. subviscida]|uniref:Xylanolytic transcriptional activator regulatory domain-containing protein n=1 Tax=Psilocybe cf. subviscida TaxID=2480587 RepID=A0A8H5F0R8_9AGAR|nr:hypothetical protein D9619_008858 [Psilocybe cf. subviscida]
MSLANDSSGVPKKRRIQHACDTRGLSMVVKCENSGKIGEPCAHCKTNGSSCTYGGILKGGAPSKTYIERLENRLERMEKVLQQLCTDDAVLRDALSRSEGNYDDFSNIILTSTSAPEPSPNPSSATKTVMTNPLDDIAMLIRSRVTESPSAIMDTVAANIRRVGQQAPQVQSRPYYHSPLNNNKYRDAAEDDSDIEENSEAVRVVTQSLKNMHVQPPAFRFFGKSSGPMLLKMAMEAKQHAHDHTGNPDVTPTWVDGYCVPMMKHLRPEYWMPRPWETSILPRSPSPIYATSSSSSSSPPSSHSAASISPSPPPSLPAYPVFHFPPADLAFSLVDNYFRYINLHFPLLHKPTFTQLVEEHGFILNEGERRVHEEGTFEKEGFAEVYLLVCALGSWYSDDPRCLLKAEPDSVREPCSDSDKGERRGMPGSAGWKWFNQVQLMRNRSLFTPPTLEDLQVYALSAQFLQASSAPQASWTMAGIGIRLAQDVGIHRRNNMMNQVPTRDGELWKRAFWVLVCIDRITSCHLGRSCAIQDEDFDLDPPIDCDDQFWDADNPDLAMRFKQPSNKPSLVTHFLLYIELTHILMFSLRTVYSINKSTALCGLIGPAWEHAVISELDSALNKWADSVPGYLKWDPHGENDLLFSQTTSLWATYYLIQILVHRPFIPSRKKTPSTTIPSLAICTNAARSCCHVVDAQQKRTGAVIPQVQMAVFQSAVVLLLSIWGGKRSGLLIDAGREMADVHKCMNMLKMAEQRWHPIGKVWDILYELTLVGDLPLPEANMRNKRARDDQGDQADAKTDSSMFARPKFSESSGYPSTAPSNSNAARPLAHSLSPGTSQPWHGVDVADPIFDFTHVTPPTYSGELFAPGVFSNTTHPVTYQGNQPEQRQEYQHTSSAPGYPFASNIPAHPTENGMNISNMGYQPLDPSLSDTNLIDLWMNTPSGFQLDEWGAYLSSVSVLTQQQTSGDLGEVPGISNGYLV